MKFNKNREFNELGNFGLTKKFNENNGELEKYVYEVSNDLKQCYSYTCATLEIFKDKKSELKINSLLGNADPKIVEKILNVIVKLSSAGLIEV